MKVAWYLTMCREYVKIATGLKCKCVTDNRLIYAEVDSLSDGRCPHKTVIAPHGLLVPPWGDPLVYAMSVEESVSYLETSAFRHAVPRGTMGIWYLVDTSRQPGAFSGTNRAIDVFNNSSLGLTRIS